MTVVVVVLVVGARTNYSFHRTLKNERERELIKPRKSAKNNAPVIEDCPIL